MTPPSVDVLDMMCRKAAMDVVNAVSPKTLREAQFEEMVVRYQWAIATGNCDREPVRGFSSGGAILEARRRMGLK